MKRIQRLNSQLLWTTRKSCFGLISVLLCMATGIFALPVQAQECEPHWSDEFPSGALLGGSVQATTVFDDGSGTGPALYVGGGFETTFELPLNHMGKLMPNGAWAPLAEGVNGNVFTLVTFDDGLGAGEALYSAGIFSEAGNIEASRIAKWDGESWSALGQGINGYIKSLVVFDDGSGPALYVGGGFYAAGEESANNIARWDGETWSLLGAGTDGSVLIMVVFNDGLGGGPALYVGGSFESAGETTALNIAKWDGEEWSAVGDGTNGTVRGAMTVFDDGTGQALYVGGSFTEAGGAEALHVAKWNGLEWSPVGGGTDDAVNNLAVFDAGSGEGPALYATGIFLHAGGVSAQTIARWDGKEWSQLGGGINGLPQTLGVFEDINSGPGLFVGGLVWHAGMIDVAGIAKWDGAHWLPAGGGGLVGSIGAIGLTFVTVEQGYALEPGLYLGGQFFIAGGVWAPRVARLNQGEWSPVGEEIGESDGWWVRALTLFDDGLGSGLTLYAGGLWLEPDGPPGVQGIAKWDGKTWSELGLGVDQEVYAMAVFDDGLGSGPLLYVTGEFLSAGGEPVPGIATWNGVQWVPFVGGGANDLISGLTVWDDGLGDGPALYANGGFTMMDSGLQANHVAKWDGVQWSALGSGTDGWVTATVAYDDGSGSALYVAGNFSIAGGVKANRIAKWDGKQWSAIPGGGIGQGNDYVYSMRVFDDGLSDHPALYIVGRFQSVGGIDAQNIARWDGMTWSTLGQGIHDNGQGSITRAWAVEIFDDGTGDGPALFAAGDFTFAGEHSSQNIAKWILCENAIPGDLDGDGVVTKSDLTILLSNWGPCDDCNNCPADINNDCSVSTSDLLILFSNWG
ncbi:MAG: hypothetical protein IH984_02175 [Planctomycetes bacterium]|nr:hypothetical protein [Planctomycetota bacterium]